MKLAFRPITAADRQFVISTWSSSFKESHSAGLIQSADWASVMHDQIGKVIDRPGASTIVAFEKREPTFLYGFISGDTTDERQPIVFYCYCKEPYRRTGIARALFGALGVDPLRPFLYACKTPIVTRLADRIPFAKWNPLVARYPKMQREETSHERRR